MEMRTQLEEPFYLLVAGEYNSGKSSFINAMCGEHILQEGPYPYNQSNYVTNVW